MTYEQEIQKMKDKALRDCNAFNKKYPVGSNVKIDFGDVILGSTVIYPAEVVHHSPMFMIKERKGFFNVNSVVK